MTVESVAVFNISGLSAAGATIGDLNGAGTIALGDKSLTVGTANSSAFSGGISGTDGSLIKQDSGPITLAGASTYPGGTRVNGGNLSVSADATPRDATGRLPPDGRPLPPTLAFAPTRAVALAPAAGPLPPHPPPPPSPPAP